MFIKHNKLLLIFIVGVLPFFITGGCEDEDGGGGSRGCPDTTVGIEICDPETGGPFTLVIDNGFFPVVVGSESVLEDEVGFQQLVITVLDEMEEVAGVPTRVLMEEHFEDGELVERSRNFFAQADDGTVCYFGEDVDNLENGQVVNNDGSWRAGENGNLPGIIMLADPLVGDVYNQEFAPGVAEDQGEVLALGDPIEVPVGNFDDTLTTEDCNPLDGGRDLKVYVDGIGLAIDEDLELVEFNP